MDEIQLLKALSDAGFFKLWAGPVGAILGYFTLIELAKFLGFKKRRDQDSEGWKCKFSEERERHLSDVRDIVRTNSEYHDHVLKKMDILITDMREDRVLTRELISALRRSKVN